MNENTKNYFSALSSYYGHHTGELMLVGSLLLITLVVLLLLFHQKTLLSAALILTMVFCGGTVNPVERGIGAITNHPVSAEILRLTKEEPDACWLVTNCEFWLSNYVLAHGARVLDSTNAYPDYEKWKLFDPINYYNEDVNRYANESAVITEEKSHVELTCIDQLKLYVNPESLKDLGIRYLFSQVDYTALL